MIADLSHPPLKGLSEGEAAKFEMTSYVLIARTQACACSAIHNYSDLHEVWTHPYKTALSNSKILKAATKLESGFPIAHVITPMVQVPLCQECIDQPRAAGARMFAPLSYSAWADTLQRKAVAERT
jgi:hypothetical protein